MIQKPTTKATVNAGLHLPFLGFCVCVYSLNLVLFLGLGGVTKVFANLYKNNIFKLSIFSNHLLLHKIMFLLSFDKYAGTDRVFLRNPPTKPKIKGGDLIQIGDDIFLSLGETVSFQEKYTYARNEVENIQVIYKSLITTKTLSLIHRMVHTRYSTYKSVVRYFLSNDLEKLLKREKEVAKKVQSGNMPDQELRLFPDIRSLLNSTEANIPDPTSIILHSKMSPKQKDLARRSIKKGLIKKVFCTHSEMFQDRPNLQTIQFHDPHKRYYANQQDPRYKVRLVVEEMGGIVKS